MGPVIGLEDATILGPCVLGHPTASADDEPLRLGKGVIIRAYAVLYQGSTIGDGAHIAHHTIVREGNVIGDGASIGASVELWPGNRIGARTRVHSGGFLESVTLGDDVFCGPNVVFTDDPHPPCPSYSQCVGGATVGDGVSIGGNSTILPGVTIGDRALVGAGSVVTKDVAAGAVVVGSPARPVADRRSLACHAGIYPHAYAWLDDGAEGAATILGSHIAIDNKASR